VVAKALERLTECRAVERRRLADGTSVYSAAQAES
jgi:hypothetical protein